jgi:DNA-directed RNA polymerase subunit RPC12/RpoP
MTPRLLTPEVEVKVKKYKCSRCGHLWERRAKKDNVLPLTCPNCKSPYWNRERIKKNSKEDQKKLPETVK